MSEMIVFAFKDATGAEQMRDKLGRLQKEQLITLSDAAVVVRKPDGKVKVKQSPLLGDNLQTSLLQTEDILFYGDNMCCGNCSLNMSNGVINVLRWNQFCKLKKIDFGSPMLVGPMVEGLDNLPFDEAVQKVKDAMSEK